MNRKQLEECAWTKTPKDERRAQKELFVWKTKKTVTEKLQGNNREVLVFDPSGDTPGTMTPWVPLWSLYSDELKQRCEEGRQPKLRAPYNRSRRDYTGDVESSGMPSPPNHATKKKSAAQLEREIAEALTKKPGNEVGSWEEDPFGGYRFIATVDGIRFDTAGVDPTYYRDAEWRRRWEFDLKREIEKLKTGKPTKLYKMSDAHYRLPGTT